MSESGLNLPVLVNRGVLFLSYPALYMLSSQQIMQVKQQNEERIRREHDNNARN